MPKYGFFLTRIFSYKDRIFEYTGIYGSEKTRILAFLRNAEIQKKYILLILLHLPKTKYKVISMIF